jgi:hypothetical protein
MRRSVLTGIALTIAPVAFSAVGCEDGPNQTYSPAPSTAAGSWNNGGADASTSDPGTQGFGAGGGGTNAVNVCTASQQQTAWSKAFTSPLVPPFQAAGIDLSAGGTFQTVTIEDVTKGLGGNQQLCQGFNGAGFCTDGSGNPGYSWGESNQVNTCYDIASHAITFFLLLPGYDGEATFMLPAMINGQPVPWAKGQDGTTGNDLKYVWHIGQPVTENGQPLDMQWAGADGGVTHSKSGASDAVANKLFLAMTYTFNATLIGVTDNTTNPPKTWMTDPNYNCVSAGLCRTSMNPDGSGGNFGARSVALYADFLTSNSSDKASAASPSDMYMWPVKYMPYSFANFNVGLDTFKGANSDPGLSFAGGPIYGPYTPAGVLSKGANPTPFCTLYMGETYGDFKKNCLMVSGDTMTDTTTLNKLLGAQHHAAEWYVFSVNGQNQNFSADPAQLAAPNYVLGDCVPGQPCEPPADSVASDLFNDIRSYGLPFNDLRGDRYPPTPAVTSVDKYEDKKIQGQDLHGTAAIMGYYRQLVFDDLRAQMPAMGITPQVDPTMCFTGGATLGYVFPDGCTGFEMMVTPSFPMKLPDTAWQDKVDLNPKGYHPITVFRSGDPTADFMADPSIGGPDDTFINGTDNLVQGSLLQVVYVMGHGNVQHIPSVARDWRYYLKFWAQAFVKYLLNRSTNPTWHDLYMDTCTGGCRQVNQDALFFDLNNGLDKFEYIDRTQATTLGSPVDFEYEVLITSTNTQQMNFYQRLTRAENALYTSMLTADSKGSKAGQVPGSNENVNLSDLFSGAAVANFFLGSGCTNLVGSPCWSGATDAMGNPIPGKDVWYCINQTKPDPDCPNENAWYGGKAGPVTDLAGNVLLDGQGRPLFTNYRGVFTGTAFSIGQTIPIQQTLPNVMGALVNLPSYADPYDSTSMNTPISVFIPHVPSRPGEGFEIPINAQRSQFIQTGSLDFSGVTITTNVDYIPKYDPMTGALTGAKIAAVETQDFLGEVWPCVDANTGDILRVKMYSSTLDIQNWLDAHPGSRSACNIFVRMSPYNNYPDYIWSTTNGVLLGINPGAGGGPPRVSDVTLFDPSLLTQTQ